MAGVVTAASMARFTLDVRNAEGQPAVDVSGSVQFVKTDGSPVNTAAQVTFAAPRTFLLPAWPVVQALRCNVMLTGHRAQASHFFIPKANQPLTIALTAMREPASWTPAFTPLAALDPDRFARLLRVAAASPDVDLKHGAVIGSLKASYDGLATEQAMSAKMALLNLYAVLSDQIDPVLGRPWFEAVHSIVRLDRERFVAEVDEDLHTSVRHILDRLEEFAPMGFFTEPDPGLHRENFPERYMLTELITIKSRFEQGNAQLTVATAQTPSGQIFLLDADMDEHSQFLLHSSDLFAHVFTGGTHPVDMHEYIVAHSARQHGGLSTIDLGYDLRMRS
jgi:hypothetical protein